MNDDILFEEKQYLGSNRSSLMRRIVLALFCFVAYYWSQNPKPVDVSVIHIGSYPVQNIENSGELFFVMGIFILLFSVLLVFMLHIRTTVTRSGIILDGLWTARKVKIDLGSIVSAQKVKFKNRLFQRPVYNLHFKGTITFFTSGTEAVELCDKDGLVYRIGSQRASELYEAIKKNLQH